MKNFKCGCNCGCCDCHKYIVLQDFWLRDVMFSKGQVIGEPVSKRWIELRLVAPYKSDIQFGKECATQVAHDLETAEQVAQNFASNEKVEEKLHEDKPLTKPNEVEVSEITVPSDTETSETEKPKKRGRPRKSKASQVIVETPEKSEILLEKMIQAEVDSL